MRVAIVEDESIAARRLERLLYEQWTDAISIKTFSALATFSEYLKDGQVDLLFLDIQLSDASGMDLFINVEVNFPVVFMSGSPENIRQAKQNIALDYLLKPITRESLQNIRQGLSLGKNSCRFMADSDLGKNESVLLRCGTRFHHIDCHNIAHVIRLDGLNLYVITTIGGASYPVRNSADLKEEDYVGLVKCGNAWINPEVCAEFTYLQNDRVLVGVNPPAEIPVIVSRNEGMRIRDLHESS